MYGLERRVQTNLCESIETSKVASKPEFSPCSGNSVEVTYLLITRCPVYRRRDSNSGFRTELENLIGGAKGKGTSGGTVRPKVLIHRSGADCFIVLRKQRNGCGGKGAGHLHLDRKGQRATGGTRWSCWKAAAFIGWHEPYESRGSSTDL